MPKSPTKKTAREKKSPPIIMMRTDPEFKKRFDDAADFRGWSMQKALERVLGKWIEEVEQERGPKPPPTQNPRDGDINPPSGRDGDGKKGYLHKSTSSHSPAAKPGQVSQ